MIAVAHLFHYLHLCVMRSCMYVHMSVMQYRVDWKDMMSASDVEGVGTVLQPEFSGFCKLFAQVRVNGKDLFVPFSIMIAQ